MSATSPFLCVVYGGGGHAQVVIDCLRLSGAAKPVAILDPNLSTDTQIEGVPVVGGDAAISDVIAQGVSHFFCGIGSTGDASNRVLIYQNALELGLAPVCAIHPSAVVAGSAKIGAGVLIAAGAIICPGACIGDNVIINTGAIVDHHCVIGDHAHIASGAVLSGDVAVGRCAHVGSGAAVKHGIKIGENAVIGTGSTVVKEVKGNTTIIGERARARF